MTDEEESERSVIQALGLSVWDYTKKDLLLAIARLMLDIHKQLSEMRSTQPPKQ